MFCQRCGKNLVPGVAWCSQCGSSIQWDAYTGVANPMQVKSASLNRRPNRILAKGIWALVLVVVVIIWRGASLPPVTQEPAAPKQKSPDAQEEKRSDAQAKGDGNRPTIPPPKFRIYRAKLDEGVSVVVPPTTSDDQLRSLLWFFRENVKSHQFKKIGIVQPTAKQWNKLGYLQGMIVVYRGSKCANEQFSDAPGLGPCGYGEHNAAVYQWGLLVNGSFDTEADSGSLSSANGTTKVFDYEDHWQPGGETQAKISSQKHSEDQSANIRQVGKKLFAEELQQRVSALGYDMTIFVSSESGEELVLDSDIFKDTSTRVAFLSSVLPKWRDDLCKAGFNQVRLRDSGFFSLGNSYSIGCG
jgi:hypothetical protein